MPRSRYRIFDSQPPYFITAAINNWLSIFTRPATATIILYYWRFLQLNSDFKLFGYVILENHLHMVAGSSNLGRDIQCFKSYTATEILQCLRDHGATRLLRLFEYFKRPHKTKSVYQVWEEGSHPQLIENEAVLIQKLEYIHQNPVKRGYVDLAEHWRYSSARNYSDLEGLIEVNTAW